ncbi:hypothetical protein GCM10023194_46000 [Planotetraspora phitsanulokensis]|uniref:STAS domain-containing protein n=1 Tax=Planotetraspora phitsanulokensis TaxID=575192 RepID=A0A8J3XHB1_9ACTN|nr:STAS domain-containing protein [Planotetraspora phitsanulokensis]GII41044.1 hypothetical protein Pph01_60470 [Planotetraspora phitsanulokensis]
MTKAPGRLSQASMPDVLYTDDQLSIRCSGRGRIRLSGQIDVTNSDAAIKALLLLYGGGQAPTCDVEDLEFIDLYGLRTLTLLSDDPVDHPVRLSNVQPGLERVLDLLAWPTFAIT